MAVDISHCGDLTTMNAIEASGRPVLVTHSNCRALVPGSARCKTDEAIKHMAATGGVMGITMVRSFVRAAGQVTIEHVLDHFDHLIKLVGVEHAGIGSDVDLDGRDIRVRPARKFDLDGIDYAKKIYDLTEGLVGRNYSSRNIGLISGGISNVRLPQRGLLRLDLAQADVGVAEFLAASLVFTFVRTQYPTSPFLIA